MRAMVYPVEAGCGTVQRARLLRRGVNCHIGYIGYIGCQCDHVMRLDFTFNYRRAEFARKLQQANARCVGNAAVFSRSRAL